MSDYLKFWKHLGHQAQIYQYFPNKWVINSLWCAKLLKLGQNYREVFGSYTGELRIWRTMYCTNFFLHMTNDMLGPNPMHIKYSSYVYDGFCIYWANFPGPIESVISKFTCSIFFMRLVANLADTEWWKKQLKTDWNPSIWELSHEYQATWQVLEDSQKPLRPCR